ncbi:MAG TPA: Holliday junction branch migration protein RuvA [Actinomycetota bacterium]|nr:Holliday junction branch migration protein RuvA [Actinomycetota bacterium]
MIGFLRGTVAGRTTDGCFLDVAGVGYRLACSATTLAAVPPEGKEVRLWTHLHVREDALALFGFATESEQRIFEALLGVSGVGPKVALQVCSAFTPEALRKALVTDDVASISSVPGIGKKTAQRMVLDLKEKLALPDLEVVGARPDALSKARSALENLGYSAGEVRVALSDVTAAADDTVEDVVKRALKVLGAGSRRAAREEIG